MRKTENNCIGCEHCINCGWQNEEVFYCDDCKERASTLYEYYGDEVCEECLIERLIEDYILNVEEETAIKNINNLFDEDTVTKIDNKFYLDKDFKEPYTYHQIIETICADIHSVLFANDLIHTWNVMVEKVEVR